LGLPAPVRVLLFPTRLADGGADRYTYPDRDSDVIGCDTDCRTNTCTDRDTCAYRCHADSPRVARNRADRAIDSERQQWLDSR